MHHEGKPVSNRCHQIGYARLGNYSKTWLTVMLFTGSSSIVDEKTHQPLLPILSLIVDTAVKLQKDGHRVVIVSSGAIAVGMRRMDMEKKPKRLPPIQASLSMSREDYGVTYRC